jgi:HNH endonuclease
MATISLIPFQANCSPQFANKSIKTALKAMAQSKHCAALWFADILKRELFKDLGYSSIYLYAEKELGFSQSRTGDFKRMADKMDDLPGLKQEMANGTIGYTKAREIIKVAGPENEREWLDEAHANTRDELARKVTLARKLAKKQCKENPAQGRLLSLPVPTTPATATTQKLTLEMSTEQFARFEAIWEKLHKLGGVPTGSTKAELILEGLANLSMSQESKEISSTSPVQIHVHRCPDCQDAMVSTSRGEIPLATHEIERLSCDAQVKEPGKTNRSTIPPSLRREVLARAHHHCRTPGCRNTHFLEIHHLVPRSRGGTNRPDNLTVLCSQCHAHLHQYGPPLSHNKVAEAKLE